MNHIDVPLESTKTLHRLIQADARSMSFIPDGSVHLVVTSPPYWTLKRYNETDGQLGHVNGYEDFVDELSKVWKECFRVLVPGGRLVCVVGDVCVSRRQFGRHVVFPLHSDICVTCRRIGFDNLNPIIWHKIANANFEVENGTKFLGKPYEPNAIIKNDIEFILMQRKPGGIVNRRLSSGDSQRSTRRITMNGSDNFGRLPEHRLASIPHPSHSNSPRGLCGCFPSGETRFSTRFAARAQR
jgi:site-specific DNA-methyltransferase (adenine-specific)